MNVQEVIDALNAIPDKSLTVYAYDGLDPSDLVEVNLVGVDENLPDQVVILSV